MPPGKRDPPTLLIFIRGRWRSVPPRSGFAVARRGRLEELRSGTVRGALRRLQLWLPSKARLGPRLSFKKIPPSDGENSDNDVTRTEQKQITLHKQDLRPCKRTRDTTSSEEHIQSVTTVATVHAEKQCKTTKNHESRIKRLLSSESKSSEISRTDLRKQTKEILIKSPKKISETSRTDLKNQELMESPKKSSVSTKIMLDSPKKCLSLRRKPVEHTNSSRQSSPILKSKDLSEKQISRYLELTSGKQNKSPKKGDAILSDSDFAKDQSEILKSKIKKTHSPKKINNISNSEFDTKNEKSSSKTQNKFHKIGPKRQKLQETSESESPKQAKEKSQTQSPKIGTCKELKIDERDIEILRTFIQNHYSDRVLLKFDTDDEYKRLIFFRINPLVKIEWCPIIDRMLRRSQDSQITLTDFASNLGLRSVTEAASIKTRRYKIRKRTEKSYVDSDSDSSSEDKENNDKMPKRIEKTKILKEREHNMRESNTGENVSNKRVLNRKGAESDSEVSITKENNKKAEMAKERTTRANHNTVESESEVSNAKENSKKGRISKTRTTRTNHNTIESDSENNNKAKERAKTENRNTLESDSEASNAKENNKKVSNTKKQTKTEIRNKEDTNSEASNTIKHNTKGSNAKKPTKRENRNSDDSDSRKSNVKRVDRIAIDNTVDTVELTSESETEEAVKAIKKTAKSKPVISSKRKQTKLEYSGLEDQAIVAWVSTGSRASRVNGNLLWRQLQDQYKQITGSRRTWHSLRNRYLRYILPKLGDLALPLSQQTRLRAAAATGEIKGRKIRSPRRNSIFTLPPRGAASRRPAATTDDTEIEIKGLPSTRSPRYSSLTRQFSRRHNMTRPSSELSDNSQRSNKLEVQDRKEKPEAKGNSPKKPYRAINSPRKQTNGKATRNAHSGPDRQSESPRQDKDSSDSSSESEDESKETNEPRRTRRSVNDANKRMSRSDTEQNATESKRNSPKKPYRAINSPRKHTNGKATRNAHSDSDRQSESPRQDRDSSASSSESEDESKETNEPRRTRRSVNDANKRMSRSDTGQNATESKRRLTRQSNILDGLDESKSRQSRVVADNHKAAREKTNESPRRNLNRHKSPNEQTSRDSSKSMSQSRRKSPVNNRRRSRRDTKNRDESNESKRRKSPIRSIRRSPTRKLNRNKSPIKQSSKGSNTSVSQERRKSKSPIKHKNIRHDSSSEESDSSSGSVSQPRRKSNRINSPQDRSNRRKSNRLISPIKQNGRVSSDSPRRKSNRLTPNELSNKRRHSSESKRKSKLAKRDSLDVIVASDSSESFETKKIKRDLKKKVDQPKKREDKQKMRRLFNPKTML